MLDGENIIYFTMFQNGMFTWQDGSPLIDYTEWYTKSLRGHEAVPCSKDSIASKHVLTGLSIRSSNPHVDHLMNYNHPMPNADHECAGFVLSAVKRSWISVPCDQKLSTRVVCHQELQTLDQEIVNISCPYQWFRWNHICVQATDEENRNASCENVANIKLRERLQSLIHLFYQYAGKDFDEMKVKKDLPLRAFLKESHHAKTQYICVMPAHMHMFDHERPSEEHKPVQRVYHIALEECSGEQFQCSDGSCIPVALYCNNITDCADGTDEAHCSWTCTHTLCTTCSWPDCYCVHGFYQCEVGGCIPVDTVCDGIMNCIDGSDEHYCELICWSGSKPCSDGLLCVTDIHWCDGIRQCIDGSDELCPYHECTSFVCQDACIPFIWLNDGISDCIHSEDEQDFLTALPQTCESANTLPCDHTMKQCYSVSDHCLFDTEHSGALSFCRRGTHLMDCAAFVCSSTYKCPGAYCIPYGRLCDGTIDCPDGSDERICPITCQGLFHCTQENICLSHFQVCNGKIDCWLSGDDEKYCFNKTHRILTMENDLIFRVDSSMNTIYQSGEYDASDIIVLENTLAVHQLLSMKLLNFSYNMLYRIPSLIFWNFQQARYIFLNNNNIKEIQTLAFQGIQRVFFVRSIK